MMNIDWKKLLLSTIIVVGFSAMFLYIIIFYPLYLTGIILIIIAIFAMLLMIFVLYQILTGTFKLN